MSANLGGWNPPQKIWRVGSAHFDEEVVYGKKINFIKGSEKTTQK